MLLIWLTTGLAAAQNETEQPPEQLPDRRPIIGGTWLQDNPNVDDTPTVDVEMIRKVRKRRVKVEPAPAPVVSQVAIDELFEVAAPVPASNIVQLPVTPSTEDQKRVPGMTVERTYDVELLLLLAA